MEFEQKKHDAYTKDMEAFFLELADIRAIARDTNLYTRISAAKYLKDKRVKPIPDDALPSVAVELQKKEQEKRSKMTPEELEVYMFNRGETIKR